MKTKRIEKILIAMDYDETSIQVAEAGFSLAQALNAETILIHVISEQPIYYSSYNYMRELQVDVIEDLKVSTQQFLDKAKNHLGNPSIKTISREGVVADMILKSAKEMNVDMIVMGSHSRNWLENIIMGSETQNVLKETNIPLYVFPTHKKE